MTRSHGKMGNVVVNGKFIPQTHLLERMRRNYFGLTLYPHV